MHSLKFTFTLHLSLRSVTNKIKVDNPLKFRTKCTLNNDKKVYYALKFRAKCTLKSDKKDYYPL